MPKLDQSVINDLTARLRRFLEATGGFEDIKYLDAGGSAAVFRVTRAGEQRAIKVFDPELFCGPAAAPTRRRLEIQKRLLKHSCPSLVQTFRAEEAEGTAFIEMEFNEWPQLASQLANIPDSAIPSIISSLVGAVRFLETQGIVHRDIKPENIHISSDFSRILLLDLGVAREFDNPDENDAAITDDAVRRPFLATAQYSSPEYLFRLDAPTAKLWQALNIYQVGAVLHDLIKKEAIFQQEISAGNRWLVARAVLTKSPTFPDGQPHRLARAKALALRCLTKDFESRLALVSWEDFSLEGATDPRAALKGRLLKSTPSAASQVEAASAERLEFERNGFIKQVRERVRTELIDICSGKIPITAQTSIPGAPAEFGFSLAANKDISIECSVHFEWQADIYERTANVFVSGQLALSTHASTASIPEKRLVITATVQPAEDEPSEVISTALAELIGKGLDHIGAADGKFDALHGLNLTLGGTE